MLYHVSIDANDPRHVAEVIAEIWGGIATPFPPVIAGSWVAAAGDSRNTSFEIYPRGTELNEAEGDADAFGIQTKGNPRSATHMAIGTKLDAESVFAIAKREGWPAKYRKRGGVFGVIELWIEGTRMIEVLTPEMQEEYRSGFTVEKWTGFLKSLGVAVPA